MPHSPHTRLINDCPTRLISAPYKTRTHLFKVLVCFFHLDIFLVILSCIVINTPVEHFVRGYNHQVQIYFLDLQTFSFVWCDMIYSWNLVVNVTYYVFEVEYEYKKGLILSNLYVHE